MGRWSTNSAEVTNFLLFILSLHIWRFCLEGVMGLRGASERRGREENGALSRLRRLFLRSPDKTASSAHVVLSFLPSQTFQITWSERVSRSFVSNTSPKCTVPRRRRLLEVLSTSKAIRLFPKWRQILPCFVFMIIGPRCLV